MNSLGINMYDIKEGDVIIQERINLQNDLATKKGETKKVNIYIENNDLRSKAYNCHTCGIQIHNRSLFTLHFKSEWHNYNLKRKYKNLPSVDEVTFLENMKRLDQLKEELNECKKRNHQEAHKKEKKDKRKNKKKETQNHNHTEHNANECEFEKEESNKNNPNQILYARDKKELLKDFVKYDNANVCFFDDRIFETMEENMKHMNTEYTFFFPSEKYIVNMKKAILNTGRAIYEGCICIFCFKRFKSVYAAQTHMIALGHTKMDDRFFDYIRKYYDFSKSYLEMLNKCIHSKEDKKEMLQMLQNGLKEKQTQNLQILFDEEIKGKKEHEEETEKEIASKEEEEHSLENDKNLEMDKIELSNEDISSYNDNESTDSEDCKITEEEFNSDISIEVIQETLEYFGFSKCYINEYGNLVLPDGSEAIHKSLAYIFKQNLTFSRMPKTQQLVAIQNEKVKTKTPKQFNHFNAPDKRYERIMKMLVKRVKRSGKKDSVAFI